MFSFPFSITFILDFIENSYKHLAHKKGLKLEIPNAENLKIYVDKEHIKTVFSNIIQNSINYSDSGKIIISVKELNNVLNINVEPLMVPLNVKNLFMLIISFIKLFFIVFI